MVFWHCPVYYQVPCIHHPLWSSVVIFVAIGFLVPYIDETNELVWRCMFPSARTPGTALNSSKALEHGKPCDTQDSPSSGHR